GFATRTTVREANPARVARRFCAISTDTNFAWQSYLQRKVSHGRLYELPQETGALVAELGGVFSAESGDAAGDSVGDGDRAFSRREARGGVVGAGVSTGGKLGRIAIHRDGRAVWAGQW